MLKHEVYQKAAEVFGTVVGVAGMVKVMDDITTEDFVGPEEYKKVSEYIDINDIICNAIDTGKYKQLQQNLYQLNRNRHHNIKDITIYKRAWDKAKEPK